jgi:hypothetical protein
VDWQVHWLEAEGDLAPWRERIAAEIELARTAVAGVLPPFRLDMHLVGDRPPDVTGVEARREVRVERVDREPAQARPIAIVSEGLAGQFAGTLFAAPPEPWECALDDTALRAHLPSAAELRAPNHDHAGWFFGFKGRSRRGGPRRRRQHAFRRHVHPGRAIGRGIGGEPVADDPVAEAEGVLAASPWSATA